MGVVIKNFSLQVSHMRDLLLAYKIELYYSAFFRKRQVFFAENRGRTRFRVLPRLSLFSLSNGPLGIGRIVQRQLRGELGVAEGLALEPEGGNVALSLWSSHEDFLN